MSDTATHVPVHHPVTGGDWQCPVGYLDTAREDGWEVVGEQAPPSAYDKKLVAELRADIESRNATLPEDEQLSTSGNKPDLIATLIADDARRGSTGSDS